MAWGKKAWTLKGLFATPVADAQSDQDTWSTLEDTLISADFGLEIAEELVATVRAEVARIGTS